MKDGVLLCSLEISFASQQQQAVGAGGAGSHILADQLTLSQPRGTYFAHHITTGTPGFSGLPTALITG